MGWDNRTSNGAAAMLETVRQRVLLSDTHRQVTSTDLANGFVKQKAEADDMVRAVVAMKIEALDMTNQMRTEFAKITIVNSGFYSPHAFNGYLNNCTYQVNTNMNGAIDKANRTAMGNGMDFRMDEMWKQFNASLAIKSLCAAEAERSISMARSFQTQKAQADADIVTLNDTVARTLDVLAQIRTEIDKIPAGTQSARTNANATRDGCNTAATTNALKSYQSAIQFSNTSVSAGP